jgi:WSC domain
MAESSISATKAPTGWSYVGCFGPKSPSSHDNSTLNWHGWDYTAINSLDSCAKKCPNSRYYGVANRWDCQCGDVIDDKVLARAPESNCNLTCAWPNDHQFCGGNSYMGVYQVWHNTQSPTTTATMGMTANSTMSRYVVLFIRTDLREIQ